MTAGEILAIGVFCVFISAVAYVLLRKADPEEDPTDEFPW